VQETLSGKKPVTKKGLVEGLRVKTPSSNTNTAHKKISEIDFLIL
jgi:hypothetical protein